MSCAVARVEALRQHMSHCCPSAVPLPCSVEWHPFKQPSRFPTRPGRHAQRLCRRTLNVLTTFAVTMDAHHTESGAWLPAVALLAAPSSPSSSAAAPCS